MKHEWPVLQNKWERLEIIQLREQWREEILMVQILYFIHIPTIKHFEFETIKKQQKEKRWEIKTNNHHTHTYNLIWKPHIHTGHPSGMISATPLIHDRRRRYSWCNRNKLTLRSYPTFSFVSMDSIFVCVREPIYVYIYVRLAGADTYYQHNAPCNQKCGAEGNETGKTVTQMLCLSWN